MRNSDRLAKAVMERMRCTWIHIRVVVVGAASEEEGPKVDIELPVCGRVEPQRGSFEDRFHNGVEKWQSATFKQ